MSAEVHRMARSDDAIDRVARYAWRGRRYQHLSDAELGRRWIKAFRSTVADPDNETLRWTEVDLFAEHRLRRLEPPHEKVAADRDRLIAHIIAKLRELDGYELRALRIERLGLSDRASYKKRLEISQEATERGSAHVIKQRALVRKLARQGSPSVKVARAVLRELERSVRRSRESRDFYATVLKGWS
jgi:hypothetical protein